MTTLAYLLGALSRGIPVGPPKRGAEEQGHTTETSQGGGQGARLSPIPPTSVEGRWAASRPERQPSLIRPGAYLGSVLSGPSDAQQD